MSENPTTVGLIFFVPSGTSRIFPSARRSARQPSVSSCGVSGSGRRRVLSIRFLGDDMVHAPRDWDTSPPFRGLEVFEYEHADIFYGRARAIAATRERLEGQAAVAMYYTEGRFKAKGGAAVDNYLTRATQVYVKENGKWKVRAAHWSPIAGGSGTNQNSID